MGIEPTYPAWKAGVLPLNYTRERMLSYHRKGQNARENMKICAKQQKIQSPE